MEKRIFISDVHMGDGFTNYGWFDQNRSNDLSSFLSALNNNAYPDVTEVVLLGDLMDTWICPIGTKPPTFEKIVSKNQQIIDTLAALGKNKMVTYIPGNHDMAITDAQVQAFFERKVGFSTQIFKKDGIWAEHGNAYGLFNAPVQAGDGRGIGDLPLGYFISRIFATKAANETDSRWYETLEDVFVSLFTRPTFFDAFIHDCGVSLNATIEMPDGSECTVQHIKEGYLNIINTWKDHPISSIDSIGQDFDPRMSVERIARGNPAKVVIFGHTHEGCVTSLTDLFGTGAGQIENKFYANNGSWTKDKSPTFVETFVYHNALNVRLMSWSNGAAKEEETGSVDLPNQTN